MIRAVLFDLGGTLHTSDSPEGRDVWFAARLTDRLADYGIEIPDGPEVLARRLSENSEVYKHWSEESLTELPSSRIWSEYFLGDYGIGEERLRPFAEELSFLYDYERMRIMRRPYLRETMEELKEMGIRLGMISNIISASVVPHFLMEYGLTDFMECVILSCTQGVRKPSPLIFGAAEEAMGLRPEELAYVGDTISRDVIGTRRAGWRLMIRIINPGTAHRDKALKDSGYQPDYLIGELSEIPEIIRTENKKIGN